MTDSQLAKADGGQKAGQIVQRAAMGAGPYMPPEPEDYAIPVLRLAQGLSKALTDGSVTGLQAGKFYSRQTGQKWDAFRGVVLRVQVGRALFSSDKLGGPLCASDDGVMPRPGMEYPGPCVQCSMRLDTPWTVPALERRTRCLKGYAVLVLEHETGAPFVYRVHGTSIGPWRDINTAFRMRYQFKPFLALVEFRAEKASNEQGNFYVCRPVVVEDMPPEKVQEYEALALQFVGVKLEAADMEDSASPEETPVGAGTERSEVGAAEGVLVAAPELRYTPNGYALLEGRLQTDGAGDVVPVQWWSEAAERYNTELKVGMRLRVKGEWKEFQGVQRLNARLTEVLSGAYQKVTPAATAPTAGSVAPKAAGAETKPLWEGEPPF